MPFIAAKLPGESEYVSVFMPCAPNPTTGFFFYVRRAEVTRAGAPLELSAKEFQLLRYFFEHRGATLSREELLTEVWGYEHTQSTRTVDVHVAWLRQKLEANPKVPQIIQTVHGLGYKFTA